MVAYSLEDARDWFLENHDGQLLCIKEGAQKYCSTYIEAEDFFRKKSGREILHIPRPFNKDDDILTHYF